jgi:hypothetical protein
MTRTSRRTFLRRSVAAAIAAPFISTSITRALAERIPSETGMGALRARGAFRTTDCARPAEDEALPPVRPGHRVAREDG